MASKKAKQIVGKAKFIFQTEGNRDTGEYRVGGATIVQLWHGIAPKKMEWHKNYSALKKFLITIYGDNHKKSFWCTASKYNLENIANIFNIPPNNIVITGYPRNDILIDYDLKKLPEIFKNNKGSLNVIYLPTHRNFGSDFNVEFIVNGLVEMDNFLVANDVNFYYKPHPNEAEILFSYLNKENIIFEKIFILSDQMYDDLYSYLWYFDVLVTDYSSVAYDFLCLDRPIILFNYDLEEYEKNDAGLSAVYYEYQLGPFCKEWDAVMQEIKRVKLGEDGWKEKRMKCKEFINPYSDGKNSYRVIKYVKEKLLLER